MDKQVRLRAYILFVSELRRAKYYLGHNLLADWHYDKAIHWANIAGLSGVAFDLVCKDVLL